MAEMIFDGPGDWRCRFENTDYDRTAKLYLPRIAEDGRVADAVTIGIVRVPNHEPVPPSFEGRSREIKAMLQAIVDEAWAQGIRPKGFDEAARDSAHQRRHLDDMRALVSKMAETPLP